MLFWAFSNAKNTCIYQKIVVECKQMFKTTNGRLFVCFCKSKICRMSNKILNKFKNLSQQATHCLHFTFPKTLVACTSKILQFWNFSQFSNNVSQDHLSLYSLEFCEHLFFPFKSLNP
jgi:hypothetical protein